MREEGGQRTQVKRRLNSPLSELSNLGDILYCKAKLRMASIQNTTKSMTHSPVAYRT
jgi:hypothetical protein